jgi:release factor glutamine methyltransferase
MRFYYRDIAIDVPGKIYVPAEDTKLIAHVLEEEEIKGKKVLEMGCGSGLLSIITAKKGAIVTSTDLDTEAIKTASANAAANKARIRFVESDLFQNVSGKYDMIVFNPPYLPDEECEKKDITYWGGKTGREVVERFIKAAKPFIRTGGEILLLISSLTGEKEVLALFHENGFKAEIVRKQKIPWEELIVIRALSRE